MAKNRKKRPIQLGSIAIVRTKSRRISTGVQTLHSSSRTDGGVGERGVLIISVPPAPYKCPAVARSPSGTPKDVQAKISITNTELREMRVLGYTQVRFLYPQHKLGNVHKARIISRDQPRCTGLARPQTQKHMQSVRARDEPGGGEGRGKTGRRRWSFLRALFALENP